MGASQVLVITFAVASAAVSVAAVWRVARAPALRYKVLWIVGSLFGFAGFATTIAPPGDLIFQFGDQEPVHIILRVGGGTVVLKALFPFVAVVALVRAKSFEKRPAG
jgi:hypothetical protein